MIVLSVMVRGHRKDKQGGQTYKPLWVERLHKMLMRNINLPTDHFCLTDQPNDLPYWVYPIDIGGWWEETVEVGRAMGLQKIPGWWAKVYLFNKNLGSFALDTPMLYCDLDSLIVKNLDPLIDDAITHPISFSPHTAPFFSRPGTLNIYSSSFMIWHHGNRLVSQFFDNWSPRVMSEFYGDQDWFAHTHPYANVLNHKYFQRLSWCIETGPAPNASVIFCVKPKNDVAAETVPWVRRIWHD